MIIDLYKLQSVIDTTGLTANSPITDLLSRTAVDAINVCKVEDGVLTVLDQVGYDNVTTWLDSNNIISPAVLQQLLPGSGNHELRQSEIIKACIQVAWSDNGIASDGGISVPGRQMEVVATAGVYLNSPAYSGEGSSPNGALIDHNGVYGSYGFQQIIDMNLDWDRIREWAVIVAPCVRVQWEDGHVKTFAFRYNNTYAPQDISIKNGDASYIGHITMQLQSEESRLRCVLKCDGVEVASTIVPNHPGVISDEHTNYRITSVRLVSNGSDWKATFRANRYKTGFWWPWEPDNYDDEGERDSQTDTPTTWVAYHAIMNKTYTVGGVTVQVGGQYPNYDHLSGTKFGRITPHLDSGSSASSRSFFIPAKLTPRRITGSSVNVRLASKVVTETPVPITIVASGSDSYLDVPSPSHNGSLSQLDMVDLDPENTTDCLRQALQDYDQPSIFDSLSQPTISSIRAFADTVAVKYDPYISMLMDNTMIMMCAEEIDIISRYLISDNETLSDRYSLSYFIRQQMSAGDTIPCDDSCFVKVEDAWCSVLNLPIGAPYSYSNGVLTSLLDQYTSLDKFGYNGHALSDIYAAMHSEEPNDYGFCEALAEARVDCQTQTTLYATINGVMNSEAWLTDAGKFLSDIVNNVKDATTQILASVGSLTPFTVGSKRALLAGQSTATIPATRVASFIDAAASLGAQSVSDVLGILASGLGNIKLTQVSERTRPILERLIEISPYQGCKLNCISAPTRKSEDTYLSTFFSRSSAAILSAVGNPNTGVSSETADAGVGLLALYPALIRATVYMGDVLSYSDNVILALNSSYIVVTPGMSEGYFDVGWYARTSGGSDLDVIQDIDASLRELKRFIDVVGMDAGVTLEYSDPSRISYTGGALAVSLMSLLIGGASGAAAGGVLGSIVGQTGVGAVLGGIAGVGLALWANASQSDVTRANINYALNKVSGLTLTITDGTQTSSDPKVISDTVANLVRVAVLHGMFAPVGIDDQIGKPLFAIYSPGRPYFRFILQDPQQDWSPLLLTAFGILSSMSTKTMIRAWGNVARTPGWIPAMVLGSAASSSVKLITSGAEAVARREDPTYAMQEDILNAVESIEVESGSYSDEQGVVTLRDLSDQQIAYMTSIMESIEALMAKYAGSSPTSLTY